MPICSVWSRSSVSSIALGVIAPGVFAYGWSKNAITVFAKELKDYKTNKKTIEVPSDWKVDAALLQKLVKARLAEIS